MDNLNNTDMKKYTINQYQEDAGRTCPSLGAKLADDTHMVLGMVTETAELADVFKKNLAYGKAIDWINIKEEVGDLLWYIINFCRINDFDVNEIMKTNIEKLKARFPQDFTEEKALNRDLEKEREALERLRDEEQIEDNVDNEHEELEQRLRYQESSIRESIDSLSLKPELYDIKLGFMLVAKDTWDENINSKKWKPINELEAQVEKEVQVVYFRTIQISDNLSENIYAVSDKSIV